MQQIDFLPGRFLEKRARRRARFFQAAALALCLAGVAGAAVGQMVLRQSVQRELRDIEPRYALAVSRQAALDELARRLREAEEAADLYTYLQHPWPRTQLLAEIVEHLPASIALTELTIATQVTQKAPASSGHVRLAPAATEDLSPARHDLRDLRELYDRQKAVTEISGRTRDVPQLHAFVGQLAGRPLFLSAKLESLEVQDDAGTARFLVRIIVRPGYGQPGGPTGPLDQQHGSPLALRPMSTLPPVPAR
jgi:hypothetical protein